MKPMKLRFAGIGSYPGNVEIDFDDLNPKGLYLIVGPTGAGKTTLLDAMTFALYGKVPSERENAIVSLHPNREKPFIEFEFAHGQRRYLVHREPALPGKQSVAGKQWIRISDELGNEIETKTGVRLVTEECETITGLSVDEFNQVILLPQGKFQRFLMAKGSEKQAVLQTIFGTAVYQRVVDRLTNKASELSKIVSEAKITLGKKQEVIDTNVAAIRNLPSFEDVESLVDDPDRLVEYLTERHKELAEEARETRELFGRLTSDKTHAEQEADRFDKGIELERLRTQQSAETDDVRRARSRCADHKRALPVKNAIDTRDELKDNAARADKSVGVTRENLAKKTAKLTVNAKITQTFVSAVPTAAPSTLSQEFAKLRYDIELADSRHSELDEKSDLLEENKSDMVEIKKNLDQLEKQLVKAQTAASQAASTLTDSRKKLRGLTTAQKAADALDELLTLADVDGATNALADAEIKEKKAGEKFDKAEATLRRAQSQRTKELAGELGAGLSPGDECPVCGSTNHPRKAKPTAASSTDLENSEKARDKANAQLTIARENLRQAQDALKNAQDQKAKLPSAGEQKKIRKTLLDLQTLDEQLDTMELKSAELTGAATKIADEINSLKTQETKTTTEGKALEKSIKDLKNAVDPVGDAAAVSDSLALCAEIELLIGKYADEVEQSNNLRGQVDQATRATSTEFEHSGFDSEQSAIAAVVPDRELSDLENLVEQFDERASRIGNLEASIGTDPLPESRPDVEEISARLSTAKEETERAAKIASAVEVSRTQIKKAIDEMRNIAPELARQEDEANKAESIAKVFDRGGGGQLSLQVWVQRTLFEEVCLVANTQLRSLSNNRYSLTLNQEEGGVAKRRGSGLDIYVLDAHTGKTRPVQTMSGGEQFMASLALALALAEVVQRHAGGIELPCLFIDEGFGGLDLDSLDLAIELLGKLHATGRTVGIITHVEAMQRQLPIGIRVTKSDSGSTLTVVGN